MEINKLEKEMLDAIIEADKKENKLKEYLYALRKKNLRQIQNHKKQIQIKMRELTEINEQICATFGHDFTPWEEKDGFIDRSWYYTRTCQICGRVETVDYIPEENDQKAYKRTR